MKCVEGKALVCLRGEVCRTKRIGKGLTPRLVESYRENDEPTILKTFFIFSH